MKEKQDVGLKLRLIHNQMHKEMEAKCKRNEKGQLTSMQRWILKFLWIHKEEAIYQRDVEAEFFVSRATASNMLQLMEKRGLIERIPVSHDARLKRLVLTQRAEQMQKQAEKDVKEMETKLLKGMTKEDIEQLHIYLDRMLQNVFSEEKQDVM